MSAAKQEQRETWITAILLGLSIAAAALERLASTSLVDIAVVNNFHSALTTGSGTDVLLIVVFSGILFGAVVLPRLTSVDQSTKSAVMAMYIGTLLLYLPSVIPNNFGIVAAVAFAELFINSLITGTLATSSSINDGEGVGRLTRRKAYDLTMYGGFMTAAIALV